MSPNLTQPLLLKRRLLLGAPLLACPAIRRAHAASAIPGVPTDRRISFDVLRNGSQIGTHVLTFKLDEDHLDVGIDIHITAGIGPITLYRYDMTGTETWRNGQFAGLSTVTNDDGTRHRVDIKRTGDGLAVVSSGFPDQTLPPAMVPLTHWSEAALSAPLLSPQDGQPIKAVITPTGQRAVALADGKSVTAVGYKIASKTPVQDWYDPTKIWVALHADAKDGSSIDYRRS